jgi:hypothetical protein
MRTLVVLLLAIALLFAAVFADEVAVQEEQMSDAYSGSSLAYGTTLRANTDVHIRAGPCTWYDSYGLLYTGETVSFTGGVRWGCGYQWYSTNRGWIAAEFLSAVGGNTGSGGSGGCRTRNYPLFKQCDSRWAWDRVGNGGTICQIGCLMSSVSMALAGLGKSLYGQSPNPGTFNAFLNSYGGYYGDEFEWGSVARFGLYYQGQTTDKATINRNICANNVVILNVMNGAHWVLATGVAPDGTYYVNDPGFYRSTYASWEVVRAGIFSL